MRIIVIAFFYVSSTGQPIFRSLMTKKIPQQEKKDGNLTKPLQFPNFLTFSWTIAKRTTHLGQVQLVDETLPPFKGRCGFRLFMPLKPAKYGIEFMTPPMLIHHNFNIAMFTRVKGATVTNSKLQPVSNSSETMHFGYEQEHYVRQLVFFYWVTSWVDEKQIDYEPLKINNSPLESSFPKRQSK